MGVGAKRGGSDDDDVDEEDAEAEKAARPKTGPGR
jgi:hypothetical protein